MQRWQQIVLLATSRTWGHVNTALKRKVWPKRHADQSSLQIPDSEPDSLTNTHIPSSFQVSQPHLSSEPGAWRMYVDHHLTWCQSVFLRREIGCSQQANPPEAAPHTRHNIIHVFVWAKSASANSKNKNSTGAAAGTCLLNKSKNSRPLGAWSWQMQKAWLSTASPFQGTADGTVKIKHACRALQFLLLLTSPCYPQSQLDPIHLLPSLSKLTKKRTWHLSFLIFLCLPFRSWQ